MNKPRVPLVLIEGIDGSGKSTTGYQVAENLSKAHPRAGIHLTDSTGLYAFRHGVLAEHRYSQLSRLEPRGTMSTLSSVAHLGAFAVARRSIDGRVRESDLHISVRDSHRIDPALYASAYGLWGVARLAPERRLDLFDRLTWAPYASSIVYLQADVDAVKLDGERDPHETHEKLEMAASELPALIRAYQDLSGGHIAEIKALTPETIDQATTTIEPFMRLPSSFPRPIRSS